MIKASSPTLWGPQIVIPSLVQAFFSSWACLTAELRGEVRWSGREKELCEEEKRKIYEVE